MDSLGFSVAVKLLSSLFLLKSLFKIKFQVIVTMQRVLRPSAESSLAPEATHIVERVISADTCTEYSSRHGVNLRTKPLRGGGSKPN